MMKSVFQLKIGEEIHPRHVITDERIKGWKYASECGSVGGGLLQHARLTITEVSAKHPDIWVRAQLPSVTPARHLKIAGEELSWNFVMA